MKILQDGNGNTIQAFSPDPAKTETITLTDGTGTWTPDTDTKTYMFYPSAQVVQKLNGGTTGLTFDARVLAGPFGKHKTTTTIVFTGTADSTVVIEAD